MRRMTEEARTYYATRPDAIPVDIQCDRCDRLAVARGTDGRRAFALCADDYMAVTEERLAGPKVDAMTRADAIRAGVVNG